MGKCKLLGYIFTAFHKLKFIWTNLGTGKKKKRGVCDRGDTGEMKRDWSSENEGRTLNQIKSMKSF